MLTADMIHHRASAEFNNFYTGHQLHFHLVRHVPHPLRQAETHSPLWGTGSHLAGPLLSGTGLSRRAQRQCWYFRASQRTHPWSCGGQKAHVILTVVPNRLPSELSRLPQVVVDHCLQDDGVPASFVHVVVWVLPRRSDGDVSPAYGPPTLRVATVLEGGHGIVQPLSARKRHEALVQPLQDGGGDLAHDHKHCSNSHPEHHGDSPVLPGPGEPPQCDGQPAARLDGDPVVCPAPFDGRFDLFEQTVERRACHAKLRLPLLIVERFGRSPQVLSGAPVANPDRPVGGGGEAQDSSERGQHERPPPPQIVPPPPVPLNHLSHSPPPQ